jgi:hypothetical protein
MHKADIGAGQVSRPTCPSFFRIADIEIITGGLKLLNSEAI